MSKLGYQKNVAKYVVENMFTPELEIRSDDELNGLAERHLCEIQKFCPKDFTSVCATRLVAHYGYSYDLALFIAKKIVNKRTLYTEEELKPLLDSYENDLVTYKEKHTDKDDTKPYTIKQQLTRLLNEKFSITVLAIPTLGAVIFCLVPLIFMILVAFTNFDNLHQPPLNLFTWNGLNNFIAMFTGGIGPLEKLPKTILTLSIWTFVWAIFATFLNYIFGMILALIINKKGIRLKKMWRTIFVITIAIPQFITLLVMAQLLADTGPIVKLIGELSGDPLLKLKLLSNGDNFGIVPKIMVILVNLWVGMPFTMLMTSGILMNIPEDLYESSRIDGASASTQFFKITLPYMLFVTGPYLITTFIGNINNFNVIFFLTGGGPNDPNLYNAGKTDLLITWLYKLTVNDKNYSLASTLGILIFVICSFVSIIMYSKTGAATKEEDFQ